MPIWRSVRFMLWRKNSAKKALPLWMLRRNWRKLQAIKWCWRSILPKASACLSTGLTLPETPVPKTKLSAVSSALTKAMPLTQPKSELPAEMWKIWTTSARLIFRPSRIRMMTARPTSMSMLKKNRRVPSMSASAIQRWTELCSGPVLPKTTSRVRGRNWVQT